MRLRMYQLRQAVQPPDSYRNHKPAPWSRTRCKRATGKLTSTTAERVVASAIADTFETFSEAPAHMDGSNEPHRSGQPRQKNVLSDLSRAPLLQSVETARSGTGSIYLVNACVVTYHVSTETEVRTRHKYLVQRGRRGF